ncbi:MAG TPA: prepilin-type N-terminal cleavage/methylation domain-containing protein [Bryobacteraceae bacterium]|jgi:hypothetical protein|nr:prepilin-type N-terminal cleavage/methylation domain-containing protein [Bryobacteraceae bacterium]
MNKDPQAGITLIEILIAVSLLSLLSVGMLVAMRLGFSTMDKTDARLVANRRVANTRAILENEIAGFTWSLAVYQPPTGNASAFSFFEAQPRSMRFLTAYSIEEAWRGRPQIAALQVIPAEKSQGVRLIVNEIPYTGPAQAGQQIAALEQDPAAGILVRYTPIEPGPRSFVLADRLSYCRFAYLEPLQEAPFRRWRPDWVSQQQLPLAVRIEMAPLDAPLDRPATGLGMGDLTAPLQVNRSPGLNYADFVQPR